MRFILCVILLGVLTVDTQAQETQRESSGAQTKAAMESEFQFDGLWKPKGAMLAGVLLPPPAINGTTLKIDENRYEVTVAGEEHSDTGTFTIDDTVTPKRMTITSLSGPNQGKTILAIFEIKDANRMRVCYDLSGKEFPVEFKAPKNTDLYLVGYRRQRVESSAEQPFVIGNRREPTGSQVCAFAKGFCDAMRRQHGTQNAASLRTYFDPRYLEQHGLQKGEIKFQMAAIAEIQNVQLADDNRSVLCHFKTDGDRSEVMLLRTVVHHGRLYLSPIVAPDQTTKLFTPWILRMAL